MKKNVLYFDSTGSTALQNILEGHRCNLSFQASCQATHALLRTRAWWPKLRVSRIQTGAWLGHIRTWLKKLGWHESSPFASSNHPTRTHGLDACRPRC